MRNLWALIFAFALLAPFGAQAATANMSVQVVSSQGQGPPPNGCQDSDGAQAIFTANSMSPLTCDTGKSEDFDRETALKNFSSNFNEAALLMTCSAYSNTWPYDLSSAGLHTYQHLSGSTWISSAYFGDLLNGSQVTGDFYIEYKQTFTGTPSDTDFWFELGPPPNDPAFGQASSSGEVDAPELGAAAWLLWAPIAYTGTVEDGKSDSGSGDLRAIFDGNPHTVGILRHSGNIFIYLDGALNSYLNPPPYAVFQNGALWNGPNMFTGPGTAGCPTGNADRYVPYVHIYH